MAHVAPAEGPVSPSLNPKVPTLDDLRGDADAHGKAVAAARYAKFPGTCPVCGAAPGTPCFVNGAANPSETHTARLEAASSH